MTFDEWATGAYLQWERGVRQSTMSPIEEKLVPGGSEGRLYSQRKGQFYFNSLYQVHSRIADQLRGTPFDPFYNDARIMQFLNIVEALWYEENENE